MGAHCCTVTGVCTVEAVVKALGLTLRDLMPPRASPSPKPAMPCTKSGNSDPGQQKTFRTAAEAVAELERHHGPRAAWWTYQNADGEPVGVIVRWDRTGRWKDIRPVSRMPEGWIIGGMPTPRPLYRLPTLADAQRVYLTEGEKAADAVASLGLIATTAPHGAQAASSADWFPLAGKECIILPDNDDPGRRYRAEIEGLASAAPLAKPEAPRPSVEAFQPFPADALPEPARSFVEMSAKAIVCDPSYVALPLLAALAAAIGNTRRIQLKRGWSDPAIIWTAIVGESGTLKTPAFKLVMRPIHDRQRDALKRHAEEQAEYEAEALRYEKALAAWKRSNEYGDPPEKPQPPQAVRYVVSDITVEALAPILLANARGVLAARDELAGLIRGFDQYRAGRGGDAQQWLSTHNGESIVVDRKTGPLRTVSVPSAAVSVTGGVQPSILDRVLGHEHRESGLLARLLLAMPPRRPKRWTDAEVPASAEAAIQATFDRLYELQPDHDGAGEPQPRIIKLTSMGKAAWISFYNQHAKEQAGLSGDLSAAWSKLEGYAARLALVVHFIRWAAQDCTLQNPDAVDETSITAGVTLSRWFGHEARRVYSILGESDEDRDRRWLLEWVERRGGEVTVRDLTHGIRQYRGDTEAARAALDTLVIAGLGHWTCPAPGPKGGRPSPHFRLVSDVTVTETPTHDPATRGFCSGDSGDVLQSALPGDIPDGINRAEASCPIGDEMPDEISFAHVPEAEDAGDWGEV